MIRCNLALILAEQNLKITKVSEDTGISRTTLTSLSSNKCQGIQLDTINTLCMYLRITPEQLLSYIPIDVKIKHMSKDSDDLVTIDLLITEQRKTVECSMYANIHYYFYPDKTLSSVDFAVDLWIDDDNEEIKKENDIIINSFKQLPRTFLTDIESEITEKIISRFLPEVESEDGDDDDEPTIPDIKISWDKRFLTY